ncbi:MAG TPA: hypothetical protein VKM54_16840, partial [Myxococcota bacterium]|nr:hypothetical protein [Myxococcota bacterium]
MAIELGRRADAEQEAQQAAVREVELRRLHEALAEVPVEGPKQMDQVRGLEHRDPLARGGLGDAGVGAEAREVEQLTTPGRAELEEGLER